MSIKIGFWNINNKNGDEIGNYIIDLINDKQLDLLFLSEYHSFLASIQQYLPKGYNVLSGSGICEKVIVIKKTELDFLVRTEGKRYLLLKSNKLDYVIVGLHLQDRRNYKDSQPRIEEINKILESVKETKCKNSIYVGDFNCMPYDEELVLASGIHAVLFKKEMKHKDNGKAKHYNPMLLLLNEINQTYGSYRYNDNTYPIYWYAFDQVIVSEELMNSIFDIEYLKSVNGKTLMTKTGNSPLISDHLPLVFRIGEE